MSMKQNQYNQNLTNYLLNFLRKNNNNLELECTGNHNNTNDNQLNLIVDKQKQTQNQNNDDDDVNDKNNVIENIEDEMNKFDVVFTSKCNLKQRKTMNDDDDLMGANNKNLLAVDLSTENNRIRIALGVIIRLVLPFFNKVAEGLKGISGIRVINAVKNLRTSREILANLFALAANTISLSLSSVQVVNKFNPLLKAMKLIRDSKNLNEIPLSPSEQNFPFMFPKSIDESPEKCVEIKILAEPPAGEKIRADIIFIHGLHGSLTNTWKQGIWKSGRRVDFERPPKPPVRPPKRPRHSRTTSMSPPHLSKRPRFRESELEQEFNDEFNENDFNRCNNVFEDEYAYFCDEPEDVEFIDDVEYSFSPFRMRMEDGDNVDESQTEFSQFQNQENGTDKDKNQTWTPCWPGDWLPIDCPGVRVIAVNYSTDPYLWRPAWIRKRNRTSLAERAREMTDLLIEQGVGDGRPIVWVGHSKGGIFIKQIIVDAWESGRQAATPLWRSARGVLFYSVPHRGSILADFKLPLLRQSTELLEIQKNCSGILELHMRFVALYRGGQLKIRVFSFVETALTFMAVIYLRIVGADSADPGIGEVCGVHLDHREICKPRNRDCILYTELAKMINKVS